jgi:opacity protein-like surface antigen
MGLTEAVAVSLKRVQRGFMMKMLVVRAAALGALCAFGSISANAADIARPVPTYKAPVVAPIYNWGGFYLGGNIGWAFGNSSATYNPTGLTWDLGKNGFMGGVQAGYNWQAGNVVFGIEGEFDWIDGKRSRAANGGLSVDGGTTSMATIAGRLGWAVDNVLWYGKGGAGWVDNTATLYNAAGQTLWTGSDTPVGWLIGAGIEIGLTPNWTTKIEYNYLNLDNWTGTPGVLNGDSISVSRTVQTIKGGINYKF